MLLKDKVAVIYGAAGAIGGSVASTFAREGAQVFLTGRTLKSVTDIAKEINNSGGVAEAALVDTLDEDAVEEHIASVVRPGRSTYRSMPLRRLRNRASRAFRSPSSRSTSLWLRSRVTCDPSS
jgi:NAD(P)-dependent dehydrogenase (short-subunit alcohol dehydrogenase family)